MEFLKFISGGYIILFVFIMLIGLFFRIRVGIGYRVGVILLALVAAVFAFCFEPGTGLDLFRLQRYAQTVNFSGSNFWTSIWGAEAMLGGTSLSGMVSFNLLCYIVRLIGDMHCLSTISVFMTIGVLLSILVDYVIDNDYSSKAFGLGVILTFLGLQLQYVFSGVRNGMAVAAVVLGAYLLLYKKHSLVISISLFLFGTTMHPAVLILAAPFLLCRVRKQKVVRLVCLFAMPAIFALPNILKSIPLSFFQYLGNRIVFYENVTYQYDRPEMIADLLIFIAIGISVWNLRKQGKLDVKHGLEEWYLNAYYILGFIMIGCSVHRDFALRIGYLMGIMGVPIACRVYAADYAEQSKLGYVSLALSAVIIVCAVKVYYDTALSFSHWIFL